MHGNMNIKYGFVLLTSVVEKFSLNNTRSTYSSQKILQQKKRVFKPLSQIFYVRKRFLIKQATFPGEGQILSSWATYSRPWGNAPDVRYLPRGTDSHLIAHTQHKWVC